MVPVWGHGDKGAILGTVPDFWGQLAPMLYVHLLLLLDDCKPVSTPVNSGVKREEEDELLEQKMYQAAVGGLLYLSTKTCPDIAYAVSNVGSFLCKTYQRTLDCNKENLFGT